jgi:predicted nucleotidyltransferase
MGIAGKEAAFNSKTGVQKIVFYSRDYCMIAYPGEKIRACGVLEKVEPKQGEPYYRVVVGYFDSYITDRREEEYVKLV